MRPVVRLVAAQCSVLKLPLNVLFVCVVLLQEITNFFLKILGHIGFLHHVEHLRGEVTFGLYGYYMVMLNICCVLSTWLAYSALVMMH